MNLSLVYLIALGILYFMPSSIAWNKHKRNRTAIFALNLLLGWTVLGWIVALIWGSRTTRRPTDSQPVRKKLWLSVRRLRAGLLRVLDEPAGHRPSG